MPVVQGYECPRCARRYEKFKRDCVCGHRPKVKSQRRTLLLVLLSVLGICLGGFCLACYKIWLA